MLRERSATFAKLGLRLRKHCKHCESDLECGPFRPCGPCESKKQQCSQKIRGHCERCMKHELACSWFKPCKHCLKAGTRCQNFRQSRGPCDHCGQNKIKCKRQFATCISCLALGLQCVTAALVHSTNSDEQTTTAAPSPELAIDITSNTCDDWAITKNTNKQRWDSQDRFTHDDRENVAPTREDHASGADEQRVARDSGVTATGAQEAQLLACQDPAIRERSAPDPTSCGSLTLLGDSQLSNMSKFEPHCEPSPLEPIGNFADSQLSALFDVTDEDFAGRRSEL